MEIQVPVSELRQKKIFVATPMYGGMCSGMYTKASCDLSTTATQYGIDVKFFYLFNESLITRARNYCVDEFLRSGYTHLMFIDSDICFNPEYILTLAALCNNDDRKKRIIVRTNIDFKKSSSNGYKKYDSKFVHFVKDISENHLEFSILHVSSWGNWTKEGSDLVIHPCSSVHSSGCTFLKTTPWIFLNFAQTT